MFRSGRFRIIALAVGVCCLALPATLLTASASTPDVNGYGVFELDGNACKDAATTPPYDWGNQTGGNTCSGTNASPATGLFNSDQSQAVAPGTTAGGKTMVNDLMCSDSGSTSTCPQSGDLAFVTGGSKDGQNPTGNWTCTDKPVTPKDEIDNAGGAVFTAQSTSTAALNGAQSVSGSTTTLTVSALHQPFDRGDTITIGSGASQQTATVSSTASVGSTTISITGVMPTAATTQASGAAVTDTATHAILYVDIERGITTGTSNAAFWLFQKPVSCSVPTGSHSATFTGDHSNGDLLLFATFNSGGTIANCPGIASTTACVEAFAWSGGAGGSLGATPQLTGSACQSSPVSDCGAVNSVNVTTPWAPHNSAATAIPANGFFEAGVDLTDFFGTLPANNPTGPPITGQPVPCLSTYLADTRSSGTQGNAVNSDLHDYISGNFTNCKATIQTTPQHSSITLGSSITDTAVVSGAPGFPAPTGSVSFWVCGPLATAPTTAGPNCTTSGTPVNNSATPPSNSVNLSGSPPTATSASFTPTQTGTYCFLGVYAGDTNYAGVSDSSSRECFVVTNTSLKTTPSKTLAFLGQSVTDSGTLTFTPAPTASNGLSAAGTLAFYVCGPLASTTTAGPNCTAAAGTAEGSATVSSLGAVSGGSSAFTPPSTGTYCFLGVYTPAAGSNYPSASDSSSGECFVVTTSSLTTTPSTTAITLGASVTDGGALTFTPAPTASNGLSAAGTLNFFVCGPLTTTTAPGPNCSSSTTGYTAEGSATVSSSGVVSNSSNAFAPKVAGTYCFLGTYTSSTGDYPTASDSSGGECFTATAAPSLLASTVSLDDTVSIQANNTAGKPSGAATFNIYGPFTSAPTTGCGGAPLKSVTIPASAEGYDASGNGYWTAQMDVPAIIDGSQSLSNPNTVWYAWGAAFDPTASGGNTNYAAGSLGCSNEVVQLSYGANSGFTIPSTTPSVTPVD